MRCPRCHEDAGLPRWKPDDPDYRPFSSRTLIVAGIPLTFTFRYPRFIQRDWAPNLYAQEKAEKDAERYAERPLGEFKCYECFFEWDHYPPSEWGEEEK